MHPCGAAVWLIPLLLALHDVRGAAVTSPPVNAAGTSLLLRRLEENTPVSSEQRALLTQLGIDQSATSVREGDNQSANGNVSQPKTTLRSQARPGETTPKPQNGVIYRGQFPSPTSRPSPFVQKPAPNLAAVSPPSGNGFPNQRPPFPSRGPPFSSRGPQFPNHGPTLPNAAARFPGPVRPAPGVGPQFRSGDPQFHGTGPQLTPWGSATRRPQSPQPAAPLPRPPQLFATAAAVPSSSSRAVSPPGAALPGFGTSKPAGRSTFQPPPLEAPPVLPLELQYHGVEGRSLPAVAPTSRQRRANWQPGHPFQGVPLEGTYLDPLQGQKTAEPAPRRRPIASERDATRPLTELARRDEPRRDSRRQRRPQERRDRYSSPDETQRDRYSTLHRESFSRQQVEPITDSSEFFSQEERGGDGGDGHRHAIGENHGYPRDHAARHVYGDGHRAGDPYNIRPTDEEVEKGYAREEEHDHYYSRQRYDEDADFGDNEGEKRRRHGKKRRNRTRRPQPKQRYTRYGEDGDDTRPRQKYAGDRERQRSRRPEARPEYDDYEADVREERRSGYRKRQRQQTAPPQYDDYGDYSSDYPADDSDDYPADYADNEYPSDYTDSEEARVPVLEDHDDFRRDRRPVSRTRLDTADDDEVEAYPVSQRRSSPERDDLRDHYAANNYGRTSRSSREGETERRKAGPEQHEAGPMRRETYQENRRPLLAERDGRDRIEERPREMYRRRQRRSVTAQDLKELGAGTSPAFLSLARAMQTVRKRRQAEEKPAETTKPLGSSEKEYQRNPHNPANFVEVPQVEIDETPAPDHLAVTEKQHQQEEQKREEEEMEVEGRYPESDQWETGIRGSQQEDGVDRDPEGTLEKSENSGYHGSRPGQAHRGRHGDFRGAKKDVTNDHQSPVWWESVKRGSLASSARRTLNSITDAADASNTKRHQKRDGFGRSASHAEFGNHFPSSPPDRSFQERPSVYISERSIPSWGPGYEGTLERRQRHAAPSVGDEHPAMVESGKRQRQHDDDIDDDTGDISGDIPGSFAEIEPVQTNRLHSEHSKLGGRQRLQQLIGASDDDTGPGGYRDHESLGSRRPGGVPGGHHDDRRHHDDEQRYHGQDQQRYPNDEQHRHHGDERRGGDHRPRPTEGERRPDSGEYYRRQPLEEPHRHPTEEERIRYPGDDRVPEDDRRRPDNRPEDTRPNRNPNYYVVTPNELASDDITSYEKPSRLSGGRGPERDRRPPPPPRYYDRPEQEDGRYDERRPEEDERRPEYDERRPEEDERRNSVYDRRPSDEERGDGGGRYQSSRRPQDDGGRYAEDERRHPEDERRHPEDERRRPEDERRYPEDERRHPEDERRRPEDERRYPEDERRYPEDERRHPEDERRYAKDESQHPEDERRRPDDERHYPEDEKRYTDADNADSGYHGDERRPSEDGGYHGDERRPSEDSGGRRHLHEEPEERPQYYREPDTRYPSSAEDVGEGGYYRRPHPEEVEQEKLYRRPQTDRYSSDDERREGEDTPQEDSQQSSPQETEEDLYSGPNQGYYDNGAPGYYGGDGPSFTRNHGDDGAGSTRNHGDDGAGLTRNHGDRHYGAGSNNNNVDTHRNGGRQPPVKSPVRADNTGPDQSEADRQVSSFISQMFKEYDPFRRSEQSL